MRLNSSYRSNWYSAILTVTAVLASSGCATTSDSQAEATFVESLVAPVPFDKAWLVTRDVLLESNVDIHTRDKRGMFVAYTDMYHRKVVVPHRTKITITLTSITEESTKISVESVHQKYGVTLLTHPEWRDESAIIEDSVSTEILKSIKSRISRN